MYFPEPKDIVYVAVVGTSGTAKKMFELLSSLLLLRLEYRVMYSEEDQVPEGFDYIVTTFKMEGGVVKDLEFEPFKDRYYNLPENRDIDRVLYDLIGIEEPSGN